MKIGFLAFHLSERGTSTALYDYAFYNEKLLGNKSIVFYPKDQPLNFPEYVKKFASDFECYSYMELTEVDEIVKEKNIDAVYCMKYGGKDERLVKNCPNLVHAVFVSEPHGERYAVISRFLSEKCGGNVPYVPHMISLPKVDGNLRSKYNIPENAIVFGGYGGQESFNIPFVHRCVIRMINENPNVYFLFMNFYRFTSDHPRVIYLPPTVDREFKVKFINTCDAMIHARNIGETFGLSVGEFSTCNKPVITYYNKEQGLPVDREHIRILGDKGLYYKDESDLMEIFRTFRKQEDVDWNCYGDYTPEKVMAVFEKVFLEGLV